MLPAGDCGNTQLVGKVPFVRMPAVCPDQQAHDPRCIATKVDSEPTLPIFGVAANVRFRETDKKIFEILAQCRHLTWRKCCIAASWQLAFTVMSTRDRTLDGLFFIRFSKYVCPISLERRILRRKNL
jgi:hypothetical protein